MSHPNGRDKVVVVKLADEVVTSEQVAERAARLRAEVINGITPNGVKEMMTALMGRAGNGEHKATMTVLQLIGSLPPAAEIAPAINNTFNVSVTNHTFQLEVARLLLASGPLPAERIGDQTGVPPEEVRSLVGTGLFRETRKGIALTAKGKKQLTA